MTEYNVSRFKINPIITPEMGNEIGNNICFPSLVRVPDWIADSFGKYYLYFGFKY